MKAMKKAKTRLQPKAVRKVRAKGSTQPRRLRALLVLGVISSVLVTAAFLSAPDRDERRAIERREVLEHARDLTSKGDIAGSTALLEPLMAEGNPDRATVTTLLANYAVAGRLADHAKLLNSTGDPSSLIRGKELHGIVLLYLQHGMRDDAVKVVAALDARGLATASELSMFGQYKVDTDDAVGGAVLARRVSPMLPKFVDSSSAAFVVRQLADRPQEVDAFLGRWLGPQPDLKTLLSISSDLVASGRAKFVMENLAGHQLESDEVRAMYSFALANVAQSGADQRVLVTPALVTQLRTAAAGKAFDYALYDVLTFADLDSVIEALGPSGEWRAPGIRSNFVYTLQANGRKPQLKALLVADASRAGTTIDQRRALAGELTGLGYSADAASILKQVAASQGPKSAAMGDLMYVWHANGMALDAAWMADLARNADQTEGDNWIEAIASHSSKAAVEQITRIDAAGGRRSGHLALLKARYLAWQGDSPALREVLSRAPDISMDSADVAEMGSIACKVSDTEAAVRLTEAGGSKIRQETRQCTTRLLAAAALGALSKGDHAKAANAYEKIRTIDDGSVAQLRSQLLLKASLRGASFEQRRGYATELTSFGFTADAANVLKQAAIAEGPRGAAMNDLLYLWKSNDMPVDTAWMGDQAKRSPNQAEEWIASIANVSADAALAQIVRIEVGADNTRLAVLKARYLAWQGDSPKLRSALSQAAQSPLKTADVAEIGNIACNVGDMETVMRLLPQVGADRSARDVRHCAARLQLAAARGAIANGDKAKANAAFADARKIDAASLTPQDYFDYGLMAADRGEATQLYLVALDRLPPPVPVDVPSELLRATILSELKRYREARQTMETVVSIDPNHTQARLQLAEICLAQGDYARALELSKGPASAPRPRKASAS